MLTVRTASAAVPAALVHGTLKAALLFAAGKAVAAVASAQAAAWTQGVLKTMFLSKLKVLAAVVLLVAVVGTGAGLLASHAAATCTGRVRAPAARPADDRGLADVPAEQEGRLVLVGTEIKDGETVSPKDRVKAPVGFLAVELGDRSDPKFKDAAAEKWWAGLDPDRDEGLRPLEGRRRAAVGQALRGPGGARISEIAHRRRRRGGAAAGDRGRGRGPARPRHAKVARLDTAEAEYREAGKTKQEAERRAQESQRLYDLHTGVISLDAYYADILNAERYAEEEKAKDAARREAGEEMRVVGQPAQETRNPQQRPGRRQGNPEATRRGDPQPGSRRPAGGAGRRRAADKPADKPAEGHANPFVSVPAQRDGVLLVVGTEIKEGEKVPADRLVVVKVGGEEKRYLRLREGDTVEEGQLLARLDDRLARLDADVQKSKVDAAKAALGTASKVHEAAVRRQKTLATSRVEPRSRKRRSARRSWTWTAPRATSR